MKTFMFHFLIAFEVCLRLWLSLCHSKPLLQSRCQAELTISAQVLSVFQTFNNLKGRFTLFSNWSVWISNWQCSEASICRCLIVAWGSISIQPLSTTILSNLSLMRAKSSCLFSHVYFCHWNQDPLLPPNS